MKKVLLRILLTSSPHVMQLVTTEDDARSKLDQWKGPNPPAFFSGYDREGDIYYAIKVDQIACMHTNDFEALKRQQEELRKQQQQQQPMPSVPVFGR